MTHQILVQFKNFKETSLGDWKADRVLKRIVSWSGSCLGGPSIATADTWLAVIWVLRWSSVKILHWRIFNEKFLTKFQFAAYGLWPNWMKWDLWIQARYTAWDSIRNWRCLWAPGLQDHSPEGPPCRSNALMIQLVLSGFLSWGLWDSRLWR